MTSTSDNQETKKVKVNIVYFFKKILDASNTAIRTEGGALTCDPTEVNKTFRAFLQTFTHQKQPLSTLSMDQVNLLDAPREEIVKIRKDFHLVQGGCKKN